MAHLRLSVRTASSAAAPPARRYTPHRAYRRAHGRALESYPPETPPAAKSESSPRTCYTLPASPSIVLACRIDRGIGRSGGGNTADAAPLHAINAQQRPPSSSSDRRPRPPCPGVAVAGCERRLASFAVSRSKSTAAASSSASSSAGGGIAGATEAGSAAEAEAEGATEAATSLSLYDTSPDWEDWFSTDEYTDVYSTYTDSPDDDDSDSAADGGNVGGVGSHPHNHLQLRPLHCPELDLPTRYLCQLLDDVRVGIRRGVDRPTTARCNRAIERLADLSIGGKKLEGRAHRSDAILRRMERYRHHHGSGGSRGEGRFSAAGESQQRGQQHQRYRRQELKFELPLPDRTTYLLVLRLFAATSGPAHLVAERTEDIVSRDMRAAYEQGGDLSLRPDVVCWNQVLMAWAASSHPEKSHRAASVLGGKMGGDVADASSYSHVLRACALSDFDDRSKRLAVEVALRVWTDFGVKRRKSSSSDDNRLEPTSHIFVYMFKIYEFMSEEGVGGAIKVDRSAMVGSTFAECCDLGLVNGHVLRQLRRVAPDQLRRGVFGEERVARSSSSSDDDDDDAIATRALRRLPEKWTCRAQASNAWGW